MKHVFLLQISEIQILRPEKAGVKEKILQVMWRIDLCPDLTTVSHQLWIFDFQISDYCFISLLFPNLGTILEVIPITFSCEFSTNLNVAATDGEKLRWLISSFSKPGEFISQASLEQNRLENA